jgi:ComF family protein
MNIITESLSGLLELFLPTGCALCKSTLCRGEQYVCIACSRRLERTNFHRDPDSPAAQRFWGKIDVEHVGCLGFYRHGMPLSRAILEFKYAYSPHTARALGSFYGIELRRDGWAELIDAIIPVPIHITRRLRRGYNQTELFARGLGKELGKPVLTDVLVKALRTKSQTRSSRHERIDQFEQLRDSFRVRRPERIEGLRLLLVDDVLTTGTTLEACAATLQAAAEVKISLVTIAFTE